MTASTYSHRPVIRIVLAVSALTFTVLLAGYQRRTGPTWPVPVAEQMGAGSVQGKLPRSHSGEGGAPIRLEASAGIEGEVLWRRYPADEPWSRLALRREGEELVAELPHQPPAGKVEYSVRLRAGTMETTLRADEAVVLRYTGAVPAGVLIPHIFCMFAALALSFRALLGALFGERGQARRLLWLLGFLMVGGMILGPLVQKFAFDAYWTGWPFGGDWTDNKTLAAVLAWVIAALVARKAVRWERLAVILAAAVMIGVYLIPHSIHGSELDWDDTGAAPTAEISSTAP